MFCTKSSNQKFYNLINAYLVNKKFERYIQILRKFEKQLKHRQQCSFNSTNNGNNRILNAHNKNQKNSENRIQQNNQEVNEPEADQHFKAPYGLIILVFYLYFTQGVFLSIPATMPYVYAQLPDYTILSIFSFAVMPFSIKFILGTKLIQLSSIYIEIFQNLLREKKNLGCDWTNLLKWDCIIVFFPHQRLIIFIFAILMFFALFFLVLQGVSLNVLALKELRKAKTVSTIIATSQTLGSVLGSLALLKLTQLQFALEIGLLGPITTPGIMLRIFAGFGFIPIIAMHFLYKERVLQQQQKIGQMSFCSIIKNYRIFLDKNSKYCRFLLLFLFYKQGYNFFIAGYEFQLVKNRGFSRDILNTIENISQVIISILIGLFGSKLKRFGVLKTFMIYFVFQQFMNLLTVILFPTSVPAIAVIVGLNSLLSAVSFLIGAFIIYSFPISGLSAMYISMLASAQNFGNDKFIQVKLTGVFGWNACAIFGLCLQAILIVGFPKIYQICTKGTDQAVINIQQCIQQTVDSGLKSASINAEPCQKQPQPNYQLELGQANTPSFLNQKSDKNKILLQ